MIFISSKVHQGLIPYYKYRGYDEFIIINRIWHSDFKKDQTYKKELKVGDVSRYNIEWNSNLWTIVGCSKESIIFNKGENTST